MISTEKIEEARKLIQKANKENRKPIVVQARDDDFNRKILESSKFDILLSVEAGYRKDKSKQLDSGLNHVVAKIASDRGIAIGIDLNELRNLEKKEKSKRIARISQNIKLCRKANTKLAIIGCKDKKNCFALLLSLGASTQQASKTLYF